MGILYESAVSQGSGIGFTQLAIPAASLGDGPQWFQGFLR